VRSKAGPVAFELPLSRHFVVTDEVSVQIEKVASLAIVIPFPTHRVKRRRLIGKKVFEPLGDAAALERADTRLVCLCAFSATLLSVALQLTLG
jgi:hypothetical protein